MISTQLNTWRLPRLVDGVVATILTVVGGCSGRPPALEHPELDAVAVGRQALEQLDQDGDGFLSKEEATAAPGLLSAWSQIDANSDSTLNAAEISDRIAFWQRGATARVWVRVHVLVGKRPLSGARVELVPEPFFQGGLVSGSGQVGQDGVATVSMSDADPPGMACGFYQVQVTHPTHKVPARFNKRTTLGLEVTGDLAASWTPLIFRVEIGGE